METMPERSGTKSHDWRTRVALGLIVMAAPTSCSNDDCSRILRHVRSERYCRVGNANRNFVTCPAQTNSSTEAGNPGAHDDDVHGSGRLRPAVAAL